MVPSRNEEKCNITGVQSQRWKEPGEACLNQTLHCSAGQTAELKGQTSGEPSRQTSGAISWRRDLSSVQYSSVAQSCPTLCNPMECSTPGLPVHHQFLELAQIHAIEVMMSSNHLILCRPFLLLPSIFPSIRVFSNQSVLCIKWPKYWSLSFNICPSNEYSVLISFRMDLLGWISLQSK